MNLKDAVAVVSNFISSANSSVQHAWTIVTAKNPLLGHDDDADEEPADWKIYFAKLTCRKTKLEFYKFGITHFKDAARRFQGNMWEEHFNVQIINSFWAFGLRSDVEKIEHLFHSRFPKNIWIEKYLGWGNWKELTGITEIVALYHGKGEGNRSCKKGVYLYSYREAFSYFEDVKQRVMHGQTLPTHIETLRCNQHNALTFEEIAFAEL